MGRGPSSPQFGGSLLFLSTSFVAELPNLTWSATPTPHPVLPVDVWGSDFLLVQPPSRPERKEPQRFPILGSPLSMTTFFGEEWRNWAMVTHMTEWLVFRRPATPSIPRRRGHSRSQFWEFFFTYAYIVRPRTTKFGVVGLVCFRRSATALHCTNAKCGLSETTEFRVHLFCQQLQLLSII